MRKVLLVIVLLIGFVVMAYAQDANEIANDVVKELRNSGLISNSEVAIIKASVKTLMKSGVTAQETKDIIAQITHQAKVEGLKGKDLAARVHEAVRIRRAQMEEEKKQVRKPKRKEEIKIKQKEIQTRSRKEIIPRRREK